jgi:RimJ/RimL family protein N-acetyltransferase
VIDVEPTLAGERTRLRAVEERDLPSFVRWRNDPDVRHWLGSSENGVPDTIESQTERIQVNRADASHRGWTVETLDGRVIGNVGLQAIEPVHTRAELAISIGEKECWSAGYGTDTVRTVLRYAFNELGLRRVHLITDADNARGIRCYECGFVHEGTLRENRLRAGVPVDMVMMGVLRSEWEARR